MATWFLSINRGQLNQPGFVSISTTAPSADIILEIVSTNGPTKKDVILALRTFEQYITGNYIPANNPGLDLPPL